MKVLLLGATGRVGSRLLPALLKHGHSVVALVRSESKLGPDIKSRLAATVVGSGTDKDTLKSTILSYGCDAVVNSAGLAALTAFGKQGELLKIFTAIADAAVAVATERCGQPLRCWFLSGWSILDAPVPPHLIIDYVPLYPEHTKTYLLIKDKDPHKEIAWSLFCANNMPPRSEAVVYPPPGNCTADNLVGGADAPPAWSQKWKGVTYRYWERF
jgi:hypothetical protein